MVDCLSKKVDKIEVMAGVALAFGVAGTVLGATSAGLGLNASGITFKVIGENKRIFAKNFFKDTYV